MWRSMRPAPSLYCDELKRSDLQRSVSAVGDFARNSLARKAPVSCSGELRPEVFGSPAMPFARLNLAALLLTLASAAEPPRRATAG
jgi:hypothetical protein